MISATIITFNEEKNIGRCLDSLQEVADEIVVVDSLSTDNTEKTCLSKNVRFIRHAFEGYAAQKNFAIEQATHDYVLALDADECLSDELKQSILEAKKNLNKDGYEMNRRNNFCGKWIYHSGWYPDRKLRLWNRTKGEWSGFFIHEKVTMQQPASVALLKGDLLHYTVTSIEQFKKQQETFAEIAALEISKKGKKSNRFLNGLRASLMLLRRYVFQLGFLDGYYGWVICLEAARYTFRKYEMAEKLRNTQVL